MPDLKQDHLHLYKRVARKTLVLLALGASLLIFPGRTPSLANAPIAKYIFDQRVLGLVFVNLGLIMAIGMYSKHRNYNVARKALRASAYYALTWVVCLIYVAVDTPSAVPITILFAYLTSNLFTVSGDPGWGAIKYIDQLKEKSSGR